MRVEHRHRRGNSPTRQVVVRHNHIKPSRHHLINHLAIRNAAINRNQKTCTTINNLPERSHIKTIPLSTSGNIKPSLNTQPPKRTHHQRRGHHTINIIIPINNNLFMPLNSLPNPAHRLSHTSHEERVVPGLGSSIKESISRLSINNAAMEEHPSRELSNAQFSR